MDDIKVSDIVLSLAGHDSGRLYVVTAIEGERVLLSDGKVRRLPNHKRKSLKHIALESGADAAMAGRLAAGVATNKELRIALAKCRASKG